MNVERVIPFVLAAVAAGCPVAKPMEERVPQEKRVEKKEPQSGILPAEKPPGDGSYEDLLKLFEQWRALEAAPMKDGAPDYTPARMEETYQKVRELQSLLYAFDIAGWPVEQQVDWHIVRAEMNGFDFNYRVLKPWARDPAFYASLWTYQSDVPAHEGPTHHALFELWTYEFPLSESEVQRMIGDLKVIPPLLEQARGNLTGNARELWVAGIRNIDEQAAELIKLLAKVGEDAPAELIEAITVAKDATEDFAEWLRQQAPSKTGPSGVGKENYTWYLQNVHLVPLSWEDEVRLLKRELHRAWANLKLEEHRNRELPPMQAATSPEEYDAQADQAASRLINYLRDNDVMPVQDNMEPALREHLGSFVPKETRNFFWITAHYDPIPLYTHFYHWWDLAQIRDAPHPSPIRRGALLYNIFDSRAEGTATGVEEMFMHAGLYDETPRSREIVWILLAQRAARGLGSLYAHANQMTMEEAGKIHTEWTPRGWMKTEPELLIFEQHLYLRQPGYGTSYVTGKYLLEELVARYAKKQEDAGQAFVLKEFFREFNEAGVIPMSLIQYQMVGMDEGLEELLDLRAGRFAGSAVRVP